MNTGIILGKLTARLEDGTTIELDGNGVTELSLNDAINKVVDSEMRKLWNYAMNSEATFTMTCQRNEFGDFINKVIEEKNKYDAMTPKEKTLYHTKDKFDTIVCPNSHIRQLFIEEFGELNYIVSEMVDDVILFDSRNIFIAT